MVSRQLRQERKEKIIELLGGKCGHCKGVFPPFCYDLHHTDPDKKYRDGAALLDVSWKKLLLELSCIELLCANCHRIVHRGESYYV